MKKQSISLVLLILISTFVQAQEIREAVQPLSAKASGGHLYTVTNDNGTIGVVYQMKLDKKK